MPPSHHPIHLKLQWPRTPVVLIPASRACKLSPPLPSVGTPPCPQVPLWETDPLGDFLGRPPSLGLRHIVNRRLAPTTPWLKQSSLSWCSPLCPFRHHIRPHIRIRPHPTSSPSFSLGWMWDRLYSVQTGPTHCICPFGRPETYSRKCEMLLHPSEVERIRRKNPGGFRTTAIPPYGRPRQGGHPSSFVSRSLLASSHFLLSSYPNPYPFRQFLIILVTGTNCNS